MPCGLHSRAGAFFIRGFLSLFNLTFCVSSPGYISTAPAKITKEKFMKVLYSIFFVLGYKVCRAKYIWYCFSHFYTVSNHVLFRWVVWCWCVSVPGCLYLWTTTCQSAKTWVELFPSYFSPWVSSSPSSQHLPAAAPSNTVQPHCSIW